MGRNFGRSAAVAAALLLAACQSPAVMVSAIPSAIPNGPIETAPRSVFAQGIDASTPMASNNVTEAPSGYIAFCARQPTECADAPGSPDTIALDAASWQALQTTNSAYNAAIHPEEDAVHYGRVDYWTIPTDGYGDCEDYALAKRHALIAAKFSPRALRIAIARSAQGEAHAVLTVATDHGDYVLDNMTDAVLPWGETKLSWIARQTPGQSQWVSLDSSSSTRLVAGIIAPLRP